MKQFFRTSFLTILAVTTFSLSAFAMDLGSAKSSGLVGETENGLVAATLPNPSPELKDLINSTNSGRLELYKEMAAKQGVPVKEIQAIAAQKMFGLAGSGEFIQQNGKWVQK